jgi:hypothetical protein
MGSSMIGRIVALLLAGFLGTTSVAAANEPTLIGVFNDWRAYTFEDTGGKICYVVSVPKKEEGNYTRRGDVFFLVTHRPSSNVFGEISTITGYTYKEGSEPQATIGGQAFSFYAEGDAAWVRRNQESDLLTAMKKGANMVVTGLSSRGTKTSDTYSLSGVTAALQKIDQECNRR